MSEEKRDYHYYMAFGRRLQLQPVEMRTWIYFQSPR